MDSIKSDRLIPHTEASSGSSTTTELPITRDENPTMFPYTPLADSCQPLTAVNPRRKTRVMSILNTTPDSFSDGGANSPADTEALRTTILSHIRAGATVIDIGGQSSRPNAPDISADEELARVLPAIEVITSLGADAAGIAISIDTYRAAVAEAAIKAGAHIINDISFGTMDPDMLATVAKLGCAYIGMHMRGTPTTMQDAENCSYPSGVIPTIAHELTARVAAAQAAGIRRWRLVLDPGIGFAKTGAQNIKVLRDLKQLTSGVDFPGLRGLPWLVGSSRKGFIGAVTGVAEAGDRVWGTAATVAMAVAGGADVVRVHDVAEMSQVVKMSDAVYREAGVS